MSLLSGEWLRPIGALLFRGTPCPGRPLFFLILLVASNASSQTSGAPESCDITRSLRSDTTKQLAEESPARRAFEEANRLDAAGDPLAAKLEYEDSLSAAQSDANATLLAFASAGLARSMVQLAGPLSEHSSRSPTEATTVEQLETALLHATRLKDLAQRAQLEIHVARSFLLLGESRRAAEVLGSAAEHASGIEAWRLHSFALGDLAKIYESQGQYEKAIMLTQRALFSAERAAAPESIYRWHWQIARLHMALAQPTAALGSFRASVAAIRRSKELAHSATEPVYEGLEALLLDLVGSAAGEEKQVLLAEIRDLLEDQNVSELRDYFRDPCLDSQRKAAPDEITGTLVVYPVLLEDGVVLISSSAGVLDRFILPVGRDDFVEEIRAFRRSLEDRTSRGYLRHADLLYRWLIKPLEPMLDSGDIETLVLVPRGALYTIPLAALYDAANRQFLIEKIPLAITPSLTLTEPKAIDRDAAKLLAAGVSESVQGYPPLASVLDELHAISELFPSRQLLNKTFKATTFAHELGEQPFGIVHIASHGEFSSNSAESFVLTFDGKISMDRLAELVGKTRFRSQSLELLTLSACESAAGDDRAALGLAGVALRAGARSALASLWSVSDRASAMLMIKFYEQIKKPGQTRAQALQRAQVSILKQRAYRHPSYWAPFLLISSWL